MSERDITVAAIQMSSTPDKEDNLETAEKLIRSWIALCSPPATRSRTTLPG